MADKTVTMRLQFATEMPPMPMQGYGSGTPANSNQDWFAADAAGMTQGKFQPKKWAQNAQIAADFALSRGRVHDQGWGGGGQVSDLTYNMFTNQGRYQSSIPGTAAHGMVQNYKQGIKDEQAEKTAQVIQHMDTFAGKLQTAATSLAYLTGASGGLSQALNRAGSVFAAFQGVGSVLGMGGTSFGGVVHGAGSMLGGLGMVGGGALGLGVGGALMGLNANNIVEGLSGRKVDRADHWDRIGGGVEQGGSRNVVAQMKSDWNSWKVATFGGGRVNSQGDFISQEQDLARIHGGAALRINSFFGSQGQGSMRAGFESQRQGYEASNAQFASQFQGYGGYAGRIGAGDNLGGLTHQLQGELGAQPAGLVSTMNKIYGNNFQGAGELAMRMQGINEQARGFAVRGAGLDVSMSQIGINKDVVRQHQGQAAAFTGAMGAMFGPQSGAALEGKKREMELQQQMIALTQQEFTVRKQMRENEAAILDTKRQQSMQTSQMLQQVINAEKQGQDRNKLSYGMQDPGQRAYIRNVLERFDKGGRKAVAPDEFSGIVAQYRSREAEASAREVADKEGFRGGGKMSDDVIAAAKGELGKQQDLVVEISKKIDAKLEMDMQATAEAIAKEMGPLIAKVFVQMGGIAGQVIKMAEGMAQLQGNQK